MYYIIISVCQNIFDLKFCSLFKVTFLPKTYYPLKVT